ncbi:tRNA (adenosine(37)-N6)-threonylcarbamoyltransferase complex transferase subunit TsaD [candidate division KSB1 bacterium]|nr:tRNA (adenosine(37)-N6)-threonylcarbamoyltransferase complex transferase subunit TsaD [candidate division KSB1 bacterium]
MLVLGIETSCDETSAALVDGTGILSNIITTQDVHQKYGGVVPEFASRAHMRQLLTVIGAALQEAQRALTDIEALAVTRGPGLAGSLLVGLSVCKGIALALKKPWIGINHIEGHILATAETSDTACHPYICLVASGGHTLLVHVKKPLQYKIVGRTIDDAAGEAFDKVAKILGLGYPGGPRVEQSAKGGNPSAISFPRALMESDSLDFSFSGLKTAVLYHVQNLNPEVAEQQTPHIAAGFQQAVVDVLIEKSLRALRRFNCRHLVLAGGVVRNTPLRTAFQQTCRRHDITLSMPAPELCTDNAAMIARAGRMRLLRGQVSSLSLDAMPNLSL